MSSSIVIPSKRSADSAARAKASVRVATTAAGTLASDVENGDTIDGVVLATGDRILIKDQASASENGIYVVQAAGAPVRASDFASGASVAAAFVFVQAGTTNADTGWLVTNNAGSDVVGTDGLTFAQFSSGAGTLAGLSDTDITAPASGDVLQYDGSDWANVTLAAAGISAAGHTHAINDLSDVTISSVADNQVLAYDATTGHFINQSPAAAGLASATHTHPASDITSGTLLHERGGLEADVSAFGGVPLISGGATVELKYNRTATVAPTANDDSGDGYAVGSRWIDVTADKEYVALDVTLGAAVWTETTQSGSSPALGSLSDVTITGVTDNELLAYDAGSGTWINQTAAEAGLAAAAHTHAAADITSGVLAHERGGLELDVSAFAGLVKISGGVTSEAVAGTDYAAASHTHAAADIASGTLLHERGGLEADVSAYGGVPLIAAGSTIELKYNRSASVAPTANDDSSAGYAVGSRWIDTTADKEYVALDVSVGAAVWQQTTGVVGPASSTDNAIARFDGTNGRTVQDSGVAIEDSGKVKSKASYADWNDATDGATVNFDLNLANKHRVTLGGNRTLALSNASVGQVFFLRLEQDGTGSRTVTWFGTIKWAGGTVPTLTTTAGKADTFGFMVTGSGTYDGFVIGQDI